MANCPNIRSQEWKDLVDKVGELQAYGYYVMNNYDIPEDIEKLSQDINTFPKEKLPEIKALRKLTEKREEILNSLVTSMNIFENNPTYTSRISALISELRSLDIQKQFVTMYEFLNKEIHNINLRMESEKDNLELLDKINKYAGTYKLSAELGVIVDMFNSQFTQEFLESNGFVDIKDLTSKYHSLVVELEKMEDNYYDYAIDCLAKRLGNESTKVRNDYKRKYSREFLANNKQLPSETKDEFNTRKQEYVLQKLSDSREEILAGEVEYIKKTLITIPYDISNIAAVVTDQRNLKSNILQLLSKLLDNNERKTNEEFLNAQHEALSVWKELSESRKSSKVLLTDVEDLYGDILEREKSTEKGKKGKLTGYYVRENGIMNSYYTSLSEITRTYFELKDLGKHEEAKNVFNTWKKENLTEEAAKKFNLKLKEVTQNQVAEKHRNKQYEELSKDPALLKAYEYLRNFNKKSDELVPVKSKLGYKLPSISKAFNEQLKANGVIKGTLLNMKEGLTFMPNESEDVDLENKKVIKKATDQNGRVLNFINIPYRGDLDNKFQSYDLFGMALTNRFVSLNYANKSLIKADLEVLRDVLENKTQINSKVNGFNVVKSIKNFARFTGKEQIEKKDTISSVKSKLYSVYDEILKDRLYGEPILPSTVKLGNYEVSLNKVVDNTIGFAAHMALGFNWKAAIANEVNGQMNTFLESIGKRNYTGYDLWVAHKKTFKDTLGMLMDAESLRPHSKTGILMYKFLDTSSDINFQQNILTLNSKAKRVLNFGTSHAASTMGEVHNNAVNMYAILNNIKVMKNGKYVDKDGNVVKNRKDAASVDEMYKEIKNAKGEVIDYKFNDEYTIEGFDKFDKNCEDFIRRKVKSIVADLQGQYDPKDKSMGERVFYAKLFSFLHRWMTRAYQRHYRGFGQSLDPEDRFYSEAEEQVKEGIYTSFSRYLGCVGMKIATLTYNQFAETPREYNMPAREDYENANIRLAYWEIGMMLFTGLISSLIALLGDEQNTEEKKQTVYAIAYYTKRIEVELKQFVPWTIPRTAYTTVTSPSAILTNYQKVSVFLDQLWNPTERYTRGKHEGELKTKVLFRRAFDPTYKVFDFDFKRSYNYMKNGK